jgi:bifunctional non-homologous end joining protein LigD
VSLERTKSRRQGVYFDFGQSARGHTLVAPYSLRAIQGAPVSCPIRPEELGHIRPAEFTLRTVPLRLRAAGDIWAAAIEPQDPSHLMRLMALAT